MNHWKLFFLGLLAVAMLNTAGCKEEDDLKVSISPTQDNACSEMAEVVCHNSFQCCVGAEIEDKYGLELTTDEKKCRKDVQLICENTYAAHIDSIEDGRARLNTEQFGRCLERMLAPSGVCFPYEEVDWEAWAECDEVSDMLQGQVAVGGDCLHDYDCAGQAFCAANLKCKNPATVGLPCVSNSDCMEELHCAYDENLMDYVCTPDVAAGGVCNNSSECAATLYCKTTESTATETYLGICAAPVANGEVCSADYDAGSYYSDMECQSGNCLMGTCANGNECSVNSDCTGTCREGGTVCSGDMDCAATCVGGYNDGVSCNEATAESTCIGECSLTSYSCSENTDCDSVCVYSDGTSTGYACTDTADCESYYGTGYTCETQTCTPGVCTPGSVCDNMSNCVGRVCAPSYGVTDYCEVGWFWLDGGAPVISLGM
ncbi:MAG: hypothetical protein JXX29_02290 [Deltaproteobacteria bacterium]|nr:hypothetical protein [Deltaproteobacteria bacterium]MBN2670470.1 hypothetical protein [Deltaproteobacteria bacterium]